MITTMTTPSDGTISRFEVITSVQRRRRVGCREGPAGGRSHAAGHERVFRLMLLHLPELLHYVLRTAGLPIPHQ